MTAATAMERADALSPNSFTQPEKCRHLATLENRVRVELMGQATEADPPAPDADLLIPAPWDEAYLYYLAAMIAYTQGETARYNEHIALFHTLWGAYADHYRRTHLPRVGFRY